MSGRGSGGAGRSKGGLLSAIMKHLACEVLHMAGNDEKKKRKKRRKQTTVQCFHCQKLGHLAKSCKNAAACVWCAEAHDTLSCKKTREAAKKCVNCGGPHAANFRRCSSICSWNGGKSRHTDKGSIEGMEKKPAADPPPPPRGDSGSIHEDTSAAIDAVRAFKSAMAEERALLRAELDAARRQVEELVSELRAAKEEATALVTKPQAGRKTGVDAGTQTETEAGVTPTGASTAPAAIQEAEGSHMEVDTSPPAHEDSDEDDVWVWSKTTIETVVMEDELPETDECLPMPDKHSVKKVLDKLVSSIRDRT